MHLHFSAFRPRVRTVHQEIGVLVTASGYEGLQGLGRSEYLNGAVVFAHLQFR